MGPWETLRERQDPELRRLASLLPDTVLGSWASSTTTKYMYVFQRWAESRQEVSVHPVQEVHCALYLGETVGSKSAVEEAVNAVGWVHQLSGLPPIAESLFVRAALEGLQRKLAKPKVRKEPITAGMLMTWVEEGLGPNPLLADVRLVATALLAFSAFLCYDELAKFRCSDILYNYLVVIVSSVVARAALAQA